MSRQGCIFKFKIGTFLNSSPFKLKTLGLLRCAKLVAKRAFYDDTLDGLTRHLIMRASCYVKHRREKNLLNLSFI